MDEFMFNTANKYELVSYADDLCIFFGTDKHYDFEVSMPLSGTSRKLIRTNILYCQVLIYSVW